MNVATEASARQLRAQAVADLFQGRVAVAVEPVADRTDCLFPLELDRITKAVSKRRNEFSTGRYCARQAIQQVRPDYQPSEILSGEKREPIWPDGLKGSITHSDQCCVAVVSDDSKIRSLGVDVEARGELNQDISSTVCVPAEIERMQDYSNPGDYVRMIFSAKESIYKALFPIYRCWIGFSEAEVRLDLAAGRFSAVMAPKLGVNGILQGRIWLLESYVFTALEIPVSLQCGGGLR